MDGVENVAESQIASHDSTQAQPFQFLHISILGLSPPLFDQPSKVLRRHRARPPPPSGSVFKTGEEVVARYYAIHEQMKPNLAKMFDKVPKMGFEVRMIEKFREATSAANYSVGTPGGARPGIFYFPLRDVTKYSTMPMEDLFLHEAIPGHHYQIAMKVENTDLPEFRRFANFGAYTEGWGLYAESLGKELGLYTDPYSYFGMLSGEMHRAIRLVTDAGLHSQGWTREQAIQYSKDHEAAQEILATPLHRLHILTVRT